MAEWPKATDCKSVEFSLHRFESYWPHEKGTWLNGRATALQVVGYGFESHCLQNV